VTPTPGLDLPVLIDLAVALLDPAEPNKGSLIANPVAPILVKPEISTDVLGRIGFNQTANEPGSVRDGGVIVHLRKGFREA
jgi:hypothetical protein